MLPTQPAPLDAPYTPPPPPTWWEKTVEYAFIQQAIRKWGMDFLAPLDAEREKEGAAQYARADKWLLIEFRKAKASVEQERARFYDYDISRSVIEEMEHGGDVQSHFHRVVYGKKDPEGRFCLGSIPYWNTLYTQKNSKPVFLDNGGDLKTFVNYVEILMPMKKANMESSPFTSVIGFNSQNKECFCMTLDDFFRHVRLST